VANEEHLRRLKEGVKKWNAWYGDGSKRANFTRANLRGAYLAHANLMNATADLTRAILAHANLRGANLPGRQTLQYRSVGR
jgi:uncharacterized protein YjbI with pentapeptide repeats